MKNRIFLGFLSTIIFLQLESAHAVNFCGWVFGKKTEVATLPPKQNAEDIVDLKSFGLAMTEGMNLNPHQGDLFEIYRQIFFGNHNDVGLKNLDSVNELVKKNPDLQKVPFYEVEISSNQKKYETPDSLAKYVKSQIQTAGQVRSNLLKIEANLGYWKKILDYQEPTQLEELTKEQQKVFSKNAKAKFEKFLNRIISKTNRELLADLRNESVDYQKKTKALYKTLQKIEMWLTKKGRNKQVIRQAMVDLIHTVGYGNPATLLLLKSKNGMDKIEGLRKILDERDEVAMALGYDHHFQELQSKLRIEFPTGFSKNENLQQNIASLEQEVLAGPWQALDTEIIRVRSLSLQESPFRSCLGGSDCSSRTYFSKALDPNYYYFTMTDSEHHSSGHVTVVLGEALNSQTRQKQQVAFIDKIQNVSNLILPTFLSAVSMSLGERGYKLALPIDLGDHNGITNSDATHFFVKKEILPHLQEVLMDFNPHQHKYSFQNRYSRAEDHLDLKTFETQNFKIEAQLKSGKKYLSSLAPQNLNKDTLIQSFLKLRDSSKIEDQLNFISSFSVVKELIKVKLFSKELFEADLEKFIKNPKNPFNVRKQAAMSMLMSQNKIQSLLKVLENFNEAEKKQIFSELEQWAQSKEYYKKSFYSNLEQNINLFYSFYNEEKEFVKKERHSVQGFYLKVLECLAIAHSIKYEDQLTYVLHPNIGEALYFASFFEEGNYLANVQKIIKNKSLQLELRKQAFLAYVIHSSKIDFLDFEISDFNQDEILDIKNRIQSWRTSKDEKYVEFMFQLSLKIDNLISEGDIDLLEKFEKIDLFKINELNKGGFPPVLLAIHYKQKKVLDWMLAHPDLDLKSWHRGGFDILEQVRRFGYNEMADYVQNQRPELESHKFKVPERLSNGSPLIKFVKIPPGYMKHFAYGRKSIKIQTPIEMMSVLTTQKMWSEVIEIGSDHVPKLQFFNRFPKLFSNSLVPIDNVSYNDVVDWIHSLNRLSQLNDPEIQKKLSMIFPGHESGDFYGLPTEAEWIYVARLEGLATGIYLYGSNPHDLNENSWKMSSKFIINEQVGSRKPILINGEPIYDIYGVLGEWIAAPKEFKLRPHDEITGVEISPDESLIKGINLSNKDLVNPFGAISTKNKNYEDHLVGFRLIRIKNQDYIKAQE
jgi:hypothetical protein